MEKKLTEAGGKAVQLDQKIDRTWRYRTKLRETSGHGLYRWDIDLVHCMFIGDQPVPMLITELTKAEPGRVIDDHYRSAVVKRWYERDAQAKFTRMVAEKLGVPAYIVLFDDDLEWIHIYSMAAKRWEVFAWQGHVKFFANKADAVRYNYEEVLNGKE